MTDLTYTGYPETVDDYAAEDVLPPPTPRRKLPVLTAILVLAVVATAGFYAGVRVQKSHNTTVAAGPTAARTGAAATGTATTARTGTGAAASGGAAGGAAGGGAAGRGRTVGLVTAVEGTSLLITDSTGNTVKVSTTPASQISKTSAGTLADIHPGDVVVIAGTKAADGSTAATSISLGGATGGLGGAAAGG
jgi:hypothetical protein